MVAFQEGIHDLLPVRLDVVGAAAEEMLSGQVEGGEVAGQRFGFREVGIVVKREPDQAADLARRQALQAVLALVQAGEGVGAGQADQLAVERVAPGVIGADQPRLAHRLRALDQPRPAVAADVQEDVRLARLVAGDQQRLAEAVVRHRHARFGQQGGRRDHQRHAREDPRLLGGVHVGRRVGGRRDLGDATPARGAAIGQQPRQRELSRGRAEVGGCVHLFPLRRLRLVSRHFQGGVKRG